VDAGQLGVLGAFRNALGLLAFHLLLAWGVRGVALQVPEWPQAADPGAQTP
jgi:hypothetical protein